MQFLLCPKVLLSDPIRRVLSSEWNTESPDQSDEKIAIEESQEVLPLALGTLAALTLGGIFCAQQLYRGLMSLGQGSEEIFRGQQLPILKFPRQTAHE